jgi:hypothetical protein
MDAIEKPAYETKQARDPRESQNFFVMGRRSIMTELIRVALQLDSNMEPAVLNYSRPIMASSTSTMSAPPPRPLRSPGRARTDDESKGSGGGIQRVSLNHFHLANGLIHHFSSL